LELLKKECSLEAELGYRAIEPFDAEARAVIVLFDVVDAAA
jgi:hypothetical protein